MPHLPGHRSFSREPIIPGPQMRQHGTHCPSSDPFSSGLQHATHPGSLSGSAQTKPGKVSISVFLICFCFPAVAFGAFGCCKEPSLLDPRPAEGSHTVQQGVCSGLLGSEALGLTGPSTRPSSIAPPQREVGMSELWVGSRAQHVTTAHLVLNAPTRLFPRATVPHSLPPSGPPPAVGSRGHKAHPFSPS